jgi:hypothetical protein
VAILAKFSLKSMHPVLIARKAKTIDLINTLLDSYDRQKEQLLSVKGIPRPTPPAVDAERFLSTSKRRNAHHVVTPRLRLVVVSCVITIDSCHFCSSSDSLSWYTTKS